MLDAFWHILRDSAPFMLFGFLVAGLLHAFLDRERLLGRLRGRSAGSVVAAAAVGLPLPLCSCSVLPTAVTLRDKGAGPGAVASFLVATPETSVSSVLLTYGLLGPVMAVVRPVAALVTAIVAGLATNRAAPPVGAVPEPVPTCTDCGCGSTTSDAVETATPPLTTRLATAVRYAFVDLFDDVFGWMVLGIAFAAALAAFLPADALAGIGSGPTAMIILILVGVPLYVCAEASTPVAAGLVAAGVSPGAALVFLLVGPATNLGSLGLLARRLGRGFVAGYLGAIVVVALAAGIVVDLAVDALAVREAAVAGEADWLPGGVATGSAILFVVLGIGTTTRWIRRRRRERATASAGRERDRAGIDAASAEREATSGSSR